MVLFSLPADTDICASESSRSILAATVPGKGIATVSSTPVGALHHPNDHIERNRHVLEDSHFQLLPGSSP
jgi:hypothetical protein